MVWGLVVMVAVVALNVLRLGLVVQSRAHWALFHESWLAQLFNPLIMATAIGLAVIAVRREILS